VNRSTRISLPMLCATAVVAFAVGSMTGLPGAHASATRVYTLRAGDKIRVPAIEQVCTLSAEGGIPDLFCARQRNARHQVTIFRDSILVWKVGHPDQPAWAGKP